jgi:hypothetical protein
MWRIFMARQQVFDVSITREAALRGADVPVILERADGSEEKFTIQLPHDVRDGELVRFQRRKRRVFFQGQLHRLIFTGEKVNGNGCSEVQEDREGDIRAGSIGYRQTDSGEDRISAECASISAAAEVPSGSSG